MGSKLASMTAEKSKLWYFQNFTLFKGMPADQMARLEAKTIMCEIGKGEYVYFPDQPSTMIYILKEGRIKIGSISSGGREVIQAILSPGEVFGELALVGKETHDDYAMALDKKVVICKLPVEQVEEMMHTNIDLNLRLNKLMGFRMMKLERKLQDLIFKDGRTRIIEFVKDLALNKGKKIGLEVFVKHNLTHQDIANLTATSRQTVTTVLNELKDKNLIYLKRNKFLVRDIDQLK